MWILLLQPLHGQSVVTFSTAIFTATYMKEEIERIKGKEDQIEEENDGEREDWVLILEYVNAVKMNETCGVVM